MEELENINESKRKYDYLADLKGKDEPTYIMEDEIVDRLYASDLKEKLSEALNTLDDRERGMITLYFLKGGYTYEAIGAIYGVSGSRVEQIVKRGLRKLRSGKNKRRLMPYIEKTNIDKSKLIEEEMVSIVEKLYRLRKMDLSDEAKAIFCSTENITLTSEDITYLSTLIDAILTNNRLDEYHYYNMYSLSYFFSEHFKNYNYSFYSIYTKVSSLGLLDKEEASKGLIRGYYPIAKLFNLE